MVEDDFKKIIYIKRNALQEDIINIDLYKFGLSFC